MVDNNSWFIMHELLFTVVSSLPLNSSSGGLSQAKSHGPPISRRGHRRRDPLGWRRRSLLRRADPHRQHWGQRQGGHKVQGSRPQGKESKMSFIVNRKLSMRIDHKHFVYTISLPELAWKKCKQTGLWFILVVNFGFISFFVYTYFQNENWANLFIIELCKRRNICVHPMRTAQCPLGVGNSLMTLRSPQRGHRTWSPDVSREELTI